MSFSAQRIFVGGPLGVHEHGGGEDRLCFAMLNNEYKGVVVVYVGLCEICLAVSVVGVEAGVDDQTVWVGTVAEGLSDGALCAEELIWNVQYELACKAFQSLWHGRGEEVAVETGLRGCG